jgi:hypothetical protein
VLILLLLLLLLLLFLLLLLPGIWGLRHLDGLLLLHVCVRGCVPFHTSSIGDT